MPLNVGCVQNVSFRANNKRNLKQSDKNKNPISVNGERSKLLAGTFIAGLGFGTRALFDLLDGDFISEKIIDKGFETAEKNFKNSSPKRQTIAAFGAAMGIMGLFVVGIALLYTAFKTPEIHYEGKVNAFRKGKDMDVYIKGNEVEKNLYSELNKKVKTATDEEKAELQQQYTLLKMAKNKVPEFAQFETSKRH